jgi:hypothetical protein
VTPEDLECLASTILAALVQYWGDVPRIYGDVNLDNILCEMATRSFSFVDPGMPEKAYLCEGVDKTWYPASRDLAYMLFDIAASVRSSIGHPVARQRQMDLIERLLLAFVERIDSAHEKACLLDELQACTRIHLRRIKANWSPAGIWRLLIRRIASRSIDKILHRVRAADVATGAHPVHGMICCNHHGSPPCPIDPSR